MDIIKPILVFRLLLTCSGLFSFEFFTDDVSYRSIYGGTSFEIKSGQLLVMKYEGIGRNKVYFEEIINGNDITIENDKYLYVNLFDKNKCLILGSRYLFAFPQSIDDVLFNDGGVFNSSVILTELENIVNFCNPDFRFAIYYEKNKISNIESSSDLIENDLIFTTEYLNKRVLLDEWPILLWNGDAQPWVEGVEGSGIGETLEISFSAPSEDIVILNGFVDPQKRYLYKANNRVKTAIIRSEDTGEPFEFEYAFEDFVHFDEIRFPRPAKKIIFEIKDVYPGEKWDDTCISAILTREPDPFD